MPYEIPLPIACSFCGVLAGLVGGGCNQMLPVWIGAATGCSLGCALSIFFMCQPEPPARQAIVAPAPIATPGPIPVIIQNVYITHISGDAKLPIARVEAL